ncbi:MAG: hypothetical protein ACYSUH_08200, partial [Planctomycetota bacterium]
MELKKMENNPALVVRKIKRVFFFIIVGFLYINSLSLGTSYSFQGFSDISSDYVFQGMSSNGELLISHSNGSSLWTHEDGASNLSGINFDGVEANATYSAETISDGGDLIVGRDISTNTSVLWNPQNGATNLHDLMGIEKP